MMAHLRAALIAMAAIALPFRGALAQDRELGGAGELLEGIAAVVDDGLVLKSELRESLGVVADNFSHQQAQLPPQQRTTLPPVSVLEKQVLEQLILDQIQLQRAERVGIVVGDDQLNQALSNVAANAGVTLEQLPDALEAEGVDYTTYREDIRETLVIRQLEQRDVLSRISVTPRELDRCLARNEATRTNDFDYSVSHILISVPGSASQDELKDAQRRIEEIHARLDAGEDFAQLALTYSDAQTALQGGSLGWRKGSELPTLFAEVVPRLQPGEYSEPIQAGSGFHIVRLDDMRGAERVVVNQVHIRHILLAPDELLDDEATHQKIIGVRQQIVDSNDFATVALAVSEDSLSAADGGDLGWVVPTEFVPEFTAVIDKLPIGELSEPFRTRYGWHIAEVLDRREHDSTEEINEQNCQNEIRTSKAEEEKQIWLRRLRDQAYVDIRL